MSKKRFNAEQIVTLLRQIEVLMAQGKSAPKACQNAGISQQLHDELLNGELFYGLKEAQIVIEQRRKHYNTIRLARDISAALRRQRLAATNSARRIVS
jgi:putative transposase